MGELLWQTHGPARAARNMAQDMALLEAAETPEAVRLRVYGWEGSCFTFGRMQPWEEVVSRVRFFVGPDEDAQIVRRPTGGGVVDHRTDWTYALVLPVGHPLCRVKALESYRVVHKALAEALRGIGAEAVLAPDSGQPPVKGLLAECFVHPSPYDVMSPTGGKMAGAAQRRTKDGLLFQGSLERRTLSESVADRIGELGATLAESLGRGLSVEVQASESSLSDDTAVTRLERQFADGAWNQRR